MPYKTIIFITLLIISCSFYIFKSYKLGFLLNVPFPEKTLISNTFYQDTYLSESIDIFYIKGTSTYIAFNINCSDTIDCNKKKDYFLKKIDELKKHHTAMKIKIEKEIIKLNMLLLNNSSTFSKKELHKILYQQKVALTKYDINTSILEKDKSIVFFNRLNY